jgi:hypothetical protein
MKFPVSGNANLLLRDEAAAKIMAISSRGTAKRDNWVNFRRT